MRRALGRERALKFSTVFTAGTMRVDEDLCCPNAGSPNRTYAGFFRRAGLSSMDCAYPLLTMAPSFSQVRPRKPAMRSALSARLLAEAAGGPLQREGPESGVAYNHRQQCTRSRSKQHLLRGSTGKS